MLISFSPDIVHCTLYYNTNEHIIRKYLPKPSEKSAGELFKCIEWNCYFWKWFSKKQVLWFEVIASCDYSQIIRSIDAKQSVYRNYNQNHSIWTTFIYCRIISWKHFSWTDFIFIENSFLENPSSRWLLFLLVWNNEYYIGFIINGE